uniref:Uncharacterized protein n=1 Tax=Xiphophorus couchianus TaxID=32473 RepID=A0A3B5LUH9_9TELE
CPTLFVEVEPIGDDRDRASQDITSDQQRLIFSCKHFQKESINPCLKGNRQIFVKTTTMDEEPCRSQRICRPISRTRKTFCLTRRNCSFYDKSQV